MDNGIREFYRTDDNKYYALPFYEAYHCISYDIDLFEEKGFYFAKGGCPSEYSAFTQNHNENKASGKFTSYKYVGDMGDRSAGPDGLYGTEDDGLPATYAEFFVLCEKMSSSNVRPITFYGNSDYLNGTATALWTDYEGKDKMRSNFTFEGKDMDIVTSFDEDKPVVTKTDITPENAYLLYNQEGRYYALDFLHTLIEKEYYDGRCVHGNARSRLYANRLSIWAVLAGETTHRHGGGRHLVAERGEADFRYADRRIRRAGEREQ